MLNGLASELRASPGRGWGNIPRIAPKARVGRATGRSMDARRVRRAGAAFLTLCLAASPSYADRSIELTRAAVELCRSQAEIDATRLTDFIDAGFAFPNESQLDAIVEFMGYTSRLWQSARQPTYRPEVGEFEAQFQRTKTRVVRASTSPRNALVVHSDATNMFVELISAPKPKCSVTYNGPFSDWPNTLGFTEENSATVPSPFESLDKSLVEMSNFKGLEPNIGSLSIVARTFEPADFGGRHPVMIWVLTQ